MLHMVETTTHARNTHRRKPDGGREKHAEREKEIRIDRSTNGDIVLLHMVETPTHAHTTHLRNSDCGREKHAEREGNTDRQVDKRRYSLVTYGGNTHTRSHCRPE